jgi:superfamily II DNA helicase RecQ
VAPLLLALHAVLWGPAHAPPNETCNVLAVLPTGSGKTALTLVPPLLEHDGVTAVLLLYRLLVTQLLEECASVGIPAARFTRADPTPGEQVRVLVIPGELGASSELASTLATLHQRGRLRRVIIDECHTFLDAAAYRPLLLASLACVRSAVTAVPFVPASATVPPAMVANLHVATGVPHVHVVRVPSARPSIYCVSNVATCNDCGGTDHVRQRAH